MTELSPDLTRELGDRGPVHTGDDSRVADGAACPGQIFRHPGCPDHQVDDPVAVEVEVAVDGEAEPISSRHSVHGEDRLIG